MDQEEVLSPAIDSHIESEAQSKNLAETLSDEELIKIGQDCLRGLEIDLESRGDWEEKLDDWIALAKQTMEIKNSPWPKASNVKYPLISTASMQFSARAYPTLVPSNGKVITSVVIGKDADGKKLEKATRVAEFLSWQVLYDIPGWEEDMDKMLMQLPIVGCMFKKTYYDRGLDKIVSRLILPKNFVVNYWTKTLEESERCSEIIEMSQRVLKERQLQKIFLDVDLGEPPTPENADNATANDETTPYVLVEQHCYLDLDDDGYSEPYIVTFERTKGTILSIYRRYTKADVKVEGKKIIQIKPTTMYTKFGFIPNPDGSFYDIGFGVLLGPLNEAVNTLINQLIDSGTLNNLNSGFIGKALKIKLGTGTFSPGEWKPVNATGDDLRKQIVPLPSKEPSNVLFQLLGTLITSGKELASVAEIFTGKMPGQNTPATTTMATVEQGMKVFTAIYKRIYRSLAQEFDKIFILNKTYLDPQTYAKVLDDTVDPEDFDDSSFDIFPGADPQATTSTEKLQKAQGLLEMLQMAPGILDPIKVISRVLDAQEQPNWQELFTKQVQQTGQVPPPPPDPKILAIQQKMQADQQNQALKTAAQQQAMELDSRDKQQQMMQAAQEHAQNMQFKVDEHIAKSASMLGESRIKLAQTTAQAQQAVIHREQAHQQSMAQAKEIAKSQPAKNSRNGNKAR